MNEDCGAAAAAKEAQPQNGLVAVDPASEAQMEGTIDGQAGQQGRSAHATGSDVSGGNSARRNEDGTTVNTADSELELAWPEGGKEYVYETARADVQAGRRLNYAEMLQHLGWPNTKRARKLLSSNYFYNRLRIKRGATGPPTSTLQGTTRSEDWKGYIAGDIHGGGSAGGGEGAPHRSHLLRRAKARGSVDPGSRSAQRKRRRSETATGDTGMEDDGSGGGQAEEDDGDGDGRSGSEDEGAEAEEAAAEEEAAEAEEEAEAEAELAWPEGGKEYVYETARADVQAGRGLNYAEMLQHLGWPNTKRARKLLSGNYFYNRLRIKRGATGPPTSTLQAAADTGGSPVLDAGASDGETEADDDNDEDEDDEELDALLLGSAAGGTAAGAGGGGGDVGDGGGNPEDEEELERRLVKALRESEATAGYLQAALDVMELAVADPGVAQYMLEQLKARLPPV